ncbi:hypothetical protein K449DRAFT_448129, partial [Hypoxylon sp. EC38]
LKVLKKLDVLPYRDRKNINPEHIHGTCVWFTDHPLFQNWRNSTSSSFLWVSADPGCGKSVLARYLVDKVLPSTDTRTTCYFFFKEDFTDQRSLAIALCCILRQIIDQRPAVLSNKIIQEFEARKTLTSSPLELWEILVNLADGRNVGEIVLIIDAFDECDKDGQCQLTEDLNKLYWANSPRPNTARLKVLLTSRWSISIQRGFTTLENRVPSIHLSAENETSKISQEIDIFIQDRIRSLAEDLMLSSEEQEILRLGITRLRHRTYLWVHLIFSTLRESIYVTKDHLKTYINRLPQTLEEAYDKILSRSRDPAMARRLLSIVVVARRPLSLGEMAVVLAIKENHKTYTDLDLEPEKRFCQKIREICGLFITIANSRIYLLHQTAKEFLVNYQPLHKPARHCLRWKHSLELIDAHRILAEVCVRYLLFDEFKMSSLLSHRKPGNRFRLFDYSAEHWITHYREANFQSDDPIQDCIFRLLDQKWSILWYRTSYDPNMQQPVECSAFILVSYLGFEQLARRLLTARERRIRLDETASGLTPLGWAAQGGHDAVVRLLLDNGANIESKDNRGSTSLSCAASLGRDSTVCLLLQKGADIESKDKKGRTALFYATIRGRDSIARLLILKGANIESRDSNGRTPLFLLQDNSTAQLLLENGSNVKAWDNRDRSPLFLVARWGDDKTLRLLLEKLGVDFESLYIDGRASLRSTVESIARLLFWKIQIDPVAWDNERNMPFSSVTIAVLCRNLYFEHRSRIRTAVRLLVKMLGVADSEQVLSLIKVAELLESDDEKSEDSEGRREAGDIQAEESKHGENVLDTEESCIELHGSIVLFQHLISQPWDREGQTRMWPIIMAIKSVLRSYPTDLAAG